MDWVARLCYAFPVGAWQMATPIYRIVAYLQASTRTACCLLLGSTINVPTTLPPFSTTKRTCHNFLNAFSLTSWRENFAVKYFAQILFSHAFVALSANDPMPLAPLRSPPFPSRCREFLVLQRKLYQCASLFSGVSLPSFFLSFFLAVVCLLGLLFSFRAFVFDLRSAMYWYFQRLFVSFSLTLLLLLLYSVLFSWFPACCVQRATCSAAASFLCIRFYFTTLFFGNFLKTQT